MSAIARSVPIRSTSRAASSFQASRTGTFDLKRRLAAQIKAHQFPMVMNCVVHRLNIDQVGQIINLAVEIGNSSCQRARNSSVCASNAPQALLVPGSADTPGD